MSSSSSSPLPDSEVKAYASRIGIDLPKESFLLPITQEGLYYAEHHPELPDGWERYEADDDNRSQYFYNSNDGSSSWDNPVDERYKQKVIETRTFFYQCVGALGIADDELFVSSTSSQSSSSSSSFTDIAAHMTFCELPEGWSAHQDEEGRTFFHNENDDSTTWNHPYVESFTHQVEELRRTLKQQQQQQQQQQKQQQPKSDEVPKQRALGVAYEETNNTNSANTKNATLSSRDREPTAMQQNNNQQMTTSSVHHHQSSPLPPLPKQSAADFLESQIPKKFEIAKVKEELDTKLKVEYHPLLGAPFLKESTNYDRAINSNDYDNVWGPPHVPNFEKNLETAKRNDFDDWFGPPIRKGKGKKPEGAPKRVLGGGHQQRQLMMQQQHQQQQQQMQGATMMQQQQQQPHPQLQQQQQPAATASSNPTTSLTQSPAVLGFARYIGIDVEKEPHLLPIAFNALQTPIPPQFRAVPDPNSGRTYFVNTAKNNETSWDHPLKDEFVKQVVETRKHQQQQHHDQDDEQNGDNDNPRGVTTTTNMNNNNNTNNNVPDHILKIATAQFNFNQSASQKEQELSILNATLYHFATLPEEEKIKSLPQGWEAVPNPSAHEEDNNNSEQPKFYFYNLKTKESRWENPYEMELEAKIKQLKS